MIDFGRPLHWWHARKMLVDWIAGILTAGAARIRLRWAADGWWRP